MEDSRPHYGSRIKFTKQGNLLVSYKIYSNGDQMVRLVIDKEKMIYKLIDPGTGEAALVGGEGTTNFEVLQRNAKKALKKFLGIRFCVEVKKKANGNS